MKATPLISVIVPVYNVEEYLPRCIESILKQTYKNLEIILVDDGSPDKCPEICDEYAQNDSRTIVIHKQNGGVSKARNIGIEKATGEFIAFVDSDDYLDETMYEKLILKQQEQNSDLVFARFKEVTEQNQTYVKEDSLKQFCEIKDLSFLLNRSTKRTYKDNYKYIYNYVMGSLWRSLFRASTIKEIKFNEDLKVMEDLIFLLEVILNNPNCTLDYVDDYLYNYFVRANSASSSKNPKVIENSKNFLMTLEGLIGETKYANYIKVFKFFCYSECVINKVVYNIKLNLQEIKNWNDKENYKAYISTNLDFKVKIRGFLIKHKMSKTLKLITKLYCKN